jgi:hypothetical protein
MKRYFQNQLIGVFDEKGTEVKEGDVVLGFVISSYHQNEHTYEVKYEPDLASFVFEEVDDGEQYEALKIHVLKVL